MRAAKCRDVGTGARHDWGGSYETVPREEHAASTSGHYSEQWTSRVCCCRDANFSARLDVIEKGRAGRCRRCHGCTSRSIGHAIRSPLPYFWGNGLERSALSRRVEGSQYAAQNLSLAIDKSGDYYILKDK